MWRLLIAGTFALLRAVRERRANGLGVTCHGLEMIGEGLRMTCERTQHSMTGLGAGQRLGVCQEFRSKISVSLRGFLLLHLLL